MRTLRIKLYKFNELSEDAKKKAVEKHYDINTDYEWWDCTYDDFEMFCKTIGIEVDQKKTYFSGFSSQGDGAAFSADVDVLELIKGVKEKKWLEHAPKTKEETGFDPAPCDIDRRVLDLIERGFIDISETVEAKDRPYRTVVQFDEHFEYNRCENYDRIYSEIYKIGEWTCSVTNDLSNHLYKLLERQHEWLTGYEAISESLAANEYDFTKDGSMWNG